MTLTPEGWVVRDLGSTNGTFLNGVEIGRAGQKLRDGDIVQCGNVQFSVKLLAETRAVEQVPPDEDLRVESALAQSWDDLPALLDSLRTSADPRRAERLLALLRIGRTSHHAGSLDAFLESFVWEAAEVLAAQDGWGTRRTPATGHRVVRTPFAWGTPLAEDVWLRIDPAGQALEQGQSLLCGQPGGGPGPGRAGSAIRSLICAPL